MPAHNFIDETGNRYGSLLVLGVVEPRLNPVRFRCLCDCGGSATPTGSNLRSGNTTSCGCVGRRHVTTANTTHGHSVDYSRSPTYVIWQGMLGRAGKRHGYLSVRVCDRWHTFENFLEDMGEAPAGKSIDRFPDKLGDYEPGNCRWATMLEQQNNRTNNRRIEYKGETKTLAEWCAELHLEYTMIHARLRLGWSVTKTFETPKRGSTAVT